MQTIRVKDLKPGMILWDPSNDNIHKKTIVDLDLSLDILYNGMVGLKIKCGRLFFFHPNDVVKIMDSKLLPML
jgi:hypothetical protein